MKFNFKKWFVVLPIVAIFMVLVPVVSAQDDAPAEPVPATEEAPAGPQTIADIAVSDPQFSILVAALTQAGLVDAVADPDASLTVLAPTDEAFTRLLNDAGISAADLLQNPALADILLYHVIPGAATSSDIAGLEIPVVNSLQGSPIVVNYDVDGSIRVNGTVNVVVKDIQASNGVIHVIDGVILPPDYASEAELNIAETATEAGVFNVLLTAAQATGLVPTLTENGPWTVFAPTDEAFAVFLASQGLTAADLLADEDALRDVLMYHIALDGITSGEVVQETELYMMNGDKVAVADLPLSETRDVEASNGIIHVLNGVLVPPADSISEVAAGNEDFSVLVAALSAADLVSVLDDDTAEFTVFAPTNAAFADALAALGITADALLADPGLSSILLYHVVPGKFEASEVVTLTELNTALSGQKITIEVTEDGVVLNGSVNVVATDIPAGNGVVHVIDGVLLPSQ